MLQNPIEKRVANDPIYVTKYFKNISKSVYVR